MARGREVNEVRVAAEEHALVNANPEEYRRRVLAFFAAAFGHR